MDRQLVYRAIDSERAYQDHHTASTGRPDMVDLDFGGMLLAMEQCLAEARREWYRGQSPHTLAMDHVRKTVALGVKAGELLGMPQRSGFEQ